MLTIEQLIDINKEIRNLPREECDFRIAKRRMQVPPLIAPKYETQIDTLHYLLDSLPQIDNSKHRAAATYYVLNLLHLFSDGNGRTARAAYCKLAELPDDHYGKSGISKEFEKKNNLLYAKKYDELAMYAFLDSLHTKKDIRAKLQMRQKEILADMNSIESSVFALTIIGGAYNYKTAKESLSALHSFNNLDEKDKKRVCCAMIDHNTGPVTAAGLAMLMFYSEKGQLDDFLVRAKQRENVWIVNIDGDECAKWSEEDFLNFAKIAEDIRAQLLKLEVDIFRNPNDYVIDEKTIAEIATNPILLHDIELIA